MRGGTTDWNIPAGPLSEGAVLGRVEGAKGLASLKSRLAERRSTPLWGKKRAKTNSGGPTWKKTLYRQGKPRCPFVGSKEREKKVGNQRN